MDIERHRHRSSMLAVCLVLAVSLLGAPVQAAPGDLDPSFGTGGKVTTDFGPGSNSARAIAIQANGMIVVVGGSGSGDFALARYNTDGSLDASFGTGGKVTTDIGVFDMAFAVAIQADGKIVAAGGTAPGGFCCQFALARYNADGSLDTSFDGDGMVTTVFGGDTQAFAVAIQSDGKIIAAGGTFSPFAADFALARYNADGSLDTSFDGDGKVTTDFGGSDGASGLAIQADGKIVASGSGGSSNDFLLARYNADGGLDTTFGTGGRVTTDFGGLDGASGIAIQTDGKIVASGRGGFLTLFALARYHADGSLDTSFDGDGKVTTQFFGQNIESAAGLAIQTNGKIVAVGTVFSDFDPSFALARYNIDGSLDTSFGGDGKVTTDFGDPGDVGILCPPARKDCSEDIAADVAVQADGTIVAAGGAGTCSPPCEFALARYLGAPTKDAYITRVFPPDIAVVDLSNGTIRRTIPFPSPSIPQQIAVSTDTRSLYVGDVPQNDFAKIDFVDIASATITQRVTIGTTTSNPIVDLALLPDGSKLYTANWTASTVTAIDVANASRSATILTGFLSYDVTSSPDGRRVYATALRSSDLFVIDPTSDRIVDLINIGRDFLGHVAITPDGKRAYITEFGNRVTVVDLLARSVVRSIPFDSTGANPNNNALDIVMDPLGPFAYVLGYDTVNVIDLLTDTIKTTIPIGKELREPAIDRDTASLYVITAAESTAGLAFTELVKIDMRSFTIADRFVIGGSLEGLAIGSRVEPPNHRPVAEAGPDRLLECSSREGTAVSLDGSHSSDPDSSPETNDDIASFEWYEGFGSALQVLLGTGVVLETTLLLGPHVLTLVVRDRAGETDTDEAVITIVDTTPPEIAIELTPSLLWPPNHRLVEVLALVNATDACSIPAVRLTSLTSSEPDDAPGSADGHTADDIQDVELGAADYDFRLRAERSGDGEGRIYGATYSATDMSGNTSFASAAAAVPHDLAGTVDPIVISLSEMSQGTLIGWPEVPGARWYNVVRGNVRDLRETPVAISLGVVACIEARSLDTSTAGHEDDDTPAAGEGFFYLAEYDDGRNSSFGSQEVVKPRLPVSSGCQ